jgi:pilus assembly protein CpaB
MRTNQRTLIFFGLALLFGVAAAFTARDLIDDRSAQAAVPALETVSVVLARADLPTGVALRDQQLETVDWPADYAPKNGFHDKEDLKGRVPRRAIAAGEPVLGASLLPEGSAAGLVSVIEQDVRAVSVKVDPVIGVAGFVRPGAHVDVLATLRRLDREKKLPYSKVILQDVEVLAIDQQMETASNGEAELVSVVTLQVTTQEAEHLIYSAHEGKLQLALRGPGDREIVRTAAVGVADLLGARKKSKSSAPSWKRVQVLKGSSMNENRF